MKKIPDKISTRPWGMKKEESPFRIHDVVKYVETGTMSKICSLSGTIGKKLLTTKNIFDREEHVLTPQSLFVRASLEEHKEFNINLIQNMGFIRGRVFTPKQKDYPLVYDTYVWIPTTRTMTLIFFDINTPSWKSVKARDIRSIENSTVEIPKELETSEIYTNLRYRIENVDGIFPIGDPLSFREKNDMLIEIEAWKSRMRIRRFKSAVDPSEGLYTVECFTQEGACKPYVTKVSHFSGHPAYFSSRVIAGLSIAVLGTETWKKSYAYTIDKQE